MRAEGPLHHLIMFYSKSRDRNGRAAGPTIAAGRPSRPGPCRTELPAQRSEAGNFVWRKGGPACFTMQVSATRDHGGDAVLASVVLDPTQFIEPARVVLSRYAQ